LIFTKTPLRYTIAVNRVKLYTFISIYFVGFCCIHTATKGQNLEIGAGAGVTLYKGDLSSTLDPQFAMPAANLFVRYTPKQAVTLKFSFMLGKIHADDSRTMISLPTGVTCFLIPASQNWEPLPSTTFSITAASKAANPGHLICLEGLLYLSLTR
jgi:hypothetical protein